MNRELDATLAELAQRLGVAAEDLWPLLVGHAFWSCVISILGAILVLALVLLSALWVFRWTASWKKRSHIEEADASTVRSIAVMVAAFAVFVCVIVIVAETPGLLYPEAVALKRLF